MQDPITASSDLAAAFRASPLFAALEEETLAELAGAAERVALPPGQPLFAGEREGVLYLLLEGAIDVREPRPHQAPVPVRRLLPGEALDALQTLAGTSLPARVTAEGACALARVAADEVDRLCAARADLAGALRRMHQRQLLSRLHPVVGPLDAKLLDEMETAAEWKYLARGDLLFEQGDAADGLFFVISGRLGVVRVERDGAARPLGEVGRGESVGEMAFFLEQTRTARVVALRDSVLVAFTNAEFDALVAGRPHLLRHVARGLVERLDRSNAGAPGAHVANVAVLAASPGAPVAAFARRLAEALGTMGPTLRLDAASVNAAMDEPGIAHAAEDAPESARLLAWIEAREAAHRFVVFETSPSADAWTRRCLRQADRVILLARADEDPAPGAVEHAVLGAQRRVTDAAQVLVLVHPREAVDPPCGTRRWLAPRPDVEAHHHLRWDHAGDLARLTRHLAGRAVGVVLGGGGARGFAHIGALRALEEAGVPVDAIGGTSMGASIAAQHALGWSADRVVEINREVWVRIRPHKVYTLPVVSILGTRKSDACGRMMYGDVEIEDLWIPFFCISSNLTTAEMVVHRRGSLLRAATASASLPGVAQPVLESGQLLVDGALLNNLPTDVMRRLGCGTVVASEVSVEEDAAFTVERIPTAREVLSGRFWRGRPVRYPSIMEVVMRASMLHSISREREAVAAADLRLRPPVEPFGLMDFDRLEEIVAVGYEHARHAVREWVEAGRAADVAPAAAVRVGAGAASAG